MKLNFIIFFVLLTFSCSGQYPNDDVKNLFSVIEVPKNLQAEETINEWYANGDGYYISRYLIVNTLDYNKVKNSLKSKDNTLPLPFGNEIIDNTIYDYVNEDDKGFYWLIYNKKDPRDIQMIILIESKKELIYFVSYQ